MARLSFSRRNILNTRLILIWVKELEFGTTSYLVKGRLTVTGWGCLEVTSVDERKLDYSAIAKAVSDLGGTGYGKIYNVLFSQDRGQIMCVKFTRPGGVTHILNSCKRAVYAWL